MPKQCGPSMTMQVFVDADHVGNLLIRRSRTGFIVFLNGAPIYWSSKKQTSCEMSTFGSKFVAMKRQLNITVAWGTSWGWWVLQWISRCLSLETISQYRPTRLHQDLHWRRSRMPLPTTLFVRAALVMSGERLTSTQMKMWLIFWRSHWLVPN